MTITALTRPDAERKQRFAQAFNRLWTASSAGSPDAAKMAAYAQSLNDLPIEAIERAGLWLQRNGGDFFPTSAKWHERAALENTQQLRDGLHRARTEPWKFECVACDDTGWEFHDCGGGPACGRTHDHAAHQYVTPCACRPTNRTYQRNREREFIGKGGQ